MSLAFRRSRLEPVSASLESAAHPHLINIFKIKKVCLVANIVAKYLAAPGVSKAQRFAWLQM